ncbi:hypothetical protein AMAG_16141 [Allomyces macrogynus ATCC 38327]|uniref:Fanconi-associated nuclease n=1 Tax=Allomyces macrogynus (strain ATCC 38327) TaxID=578462 RepID=A0A0L0TAL5_ALLM3|nr:hypothetical protein AMAG_16141 [Allomyces macrogynus ATCC 38327]|eukprot:KNE71579.1 hypothetical protein AMAG_16141 [Allomyces macrogynus ATCC 38327]
MYRALFTTQVQTIHDHESHLLSDDERGRLDLFLGATEPAQSLYCRILMRKRDKWLRVSSFLEYQDVGSSPTEITAALDELLVFGLVEELDQTVPDNDSRDDHVKEDSRVGTLWFEWVSVMTIDEMKQIVQSIRVSVPGISSLNKAQIQESLRSLAPSPRTRALAAATTFLGRLVKIPADVNQLMTRLDLIYFRWRSWGEGTLTTAILTQIGRVKFPRADCTRSGLVFPTRDDLLAYERALQWRQAMDEVVEANDPVAAEHVYDQIRPMWDQAVRDELGHITGIEWYQRYCPGWPCTKALEIYAPFLAKQKRHADALDLFEALLNQHLFRQAKRGDWYKDAALIQHAHLKQLKAAHATCIRGLEDPRTHPSARTALQRRLARVQVQLRLPWREQRRFEEVALRTPHEHVMYATRVVESVGLKPRYWWPDPAAQGGEDGGQVAGRGDDDQGEVPALEQVGVEEYALRSYLAHEGFAGGSCSENSMLCTLFGLLFFDELFDASVPGVFETPYQSAPLDLGSECFYRSRQEQIERKLAQIESGDFISIMERVDHAEREERTLIAGVNWGLAWDDLALVANAIGGPALATICRFFAEDYYHNAAGMPDLCLWTKSPSPRPEDQEASAVDADQEYKVVFAEVKGPHDTLSDKQRVWIDSLLAAGIDVHLCLVKLHPGDPAAAAPVAEEDDAELSDDGAGSGGASGSRTGAGRGGGRGRGVSSASRRGGRPRADRLAAADAEAPPSKRARKR